MGSERIEGTGEARYFNKFFTVTCQADNTATAFERQT